MRITLWSEIQGAAFKPPPVVMKEEGKILEFHDYPYAYDMQVGDEIRYQTSLGTASFVVTEVRPAELPEYPPELNLVTATRKVP